MNLPSSAVWPASFERLPFSDTQDDAFANRFGIVDAPDHRGEGSKQEEHPRCLALVQCVTEDGRSRVL